jgi:hypothetical protein
MLLLLLLLLLLLPSVDAAAPPDFALSTVLRTVFSRCSADKVSDSNDGNVGGDHHTTHPL